MATLAPTSRVVAFACSCLPSLWIAWRSSLTSHEQCTRLLYLKYLLVTADAFISTGSLHFPSASGAKKWNLHNGTCRKTNVCLKTSVLEKGPVDDHHHCLTISVDDTGRPDSRKLEV